MNMYKTYYILLSIFCFLFIGFIGIHSFLKFKPYLVTKKLKSLCIILKYVFFIVSLYCFILILSITPVIKTLNEYRYRLTSEDNIIYFTNDYYIEDDLTVSFAAEYKMLDAVRKMSEEEMENYKNGEFRTFYSNIPVKKIYDKKRKRFVKITPTYTDLQKRF